LKKLLTIFFLSFFSASTFGQDSTAFIYEYRLGTHYIIKTRNEVHRGYVIEETTDAITVEHRVTHQKSILKKSEILSAKPAPPNAMGRIVEEENLHARNYLLSSSAFLFEPNTSHSTGHWLLLENIDYAFSKNWAVDLNALAFYPFSLGVKCAYKVGDEEFIGANVFGVGDFFSSNSNSFFWGYGACAKFTKGSSNHNFTFSAGLLGINSDIYTYRNVSFVNMAFLGGAYCNRISKLLALNLEGWYLPESQVGLGGVGVKFLGNESFCWTLGCFTLLNNYSNTFRINGKNIPIPYFSLSRKFQ
jgi:hypothetical protein